MSRLESTFERCKAASRAALVTYAMAYDPSKQATAEILTRLADSGADVIELGMPFSDPVADGPTIQEAANRALKAGGSVRGTLELVKEFREGNSDTPIILMGYYNPVYHYGIEAFVNDAVAAGVDGVILVDLTPEEEAEFVDISEPAGLAHIKLTAPTTTAERAKTVLKRASGFVYYISIAGITGTEAANEDSIAKQVAELRTVTDLPIAVGFGIKTPEQAANVAKHADAVVIGSAIVNLIAGSSDYSAVSDYVTSIAGALGK